MKFSHAFVTVILIFLSGIVKAQTPQAQWGIAIGDGPGGNDKVNDIVADGSGNIYVCGVFRNVFDADPSMGVHLLSSSGGDDIWFAKYSPNGQLVWAQSIGSNNTDNANSISLDTDGNIYLGGNFLNTIDFDPGSGVTELSAIVSSNSDGFIAKYNNNGNFISAFQIGGASVDNVQQVEVDYEGNLVVTGNVSGICDFDPSSSTFNLTAGFNTIFLAKYSANGQFIWAFILSSSGPNNGQSIGILLNNSIVLGAIFQGDFDADPGNDFVPISHNNNYDAFLGCYTSDGEYVWSGSIGGTGEDRINSLVVDEDNQIFVGGFFNATVDFDLAFETSEVTSVGNDDAFLASYTSNGGLTWVRTWGGTGADEVQSVSINNQGRVSVSGGYNGIVDFNPQSGVDLKTAIGGTDAFVSVFSDNGNYINSVCVGGIGYDFANATLISTNSVFFAGLFANSVDFDPSSSDEIRVADSQTSFYASYQTTSSTPELIQAFQDRDGGDDVVNAMATDASGNLYVCGNFEGSAVFDETSGEFASNGATDAFLAKYSPSGELLLQITFGGTGNDVARDIVLASDGSIYVTGDFEGTMDIDPSSAVSNLVSAGDKDIFIVRYNALGQPIWSQSIGGGAEDLCYSILLSNDGNPFICGQFRGTADFDPGNGVTSFTALNRDLFIAGYSASNGNLIWAKQVDGASNAYGRMLAFDSENNVYAGGLFQGSIDADPGVSTFNMTSAGNNDGLLIKLTPSGDFVWAMQFGGTQADLLTDIEIDQENNIYLGGYFNSNFDIDPNPEVEQVSSNGNSDIFVMKFNSTENSVTGLPEVEWVHTFGDIGFDYLFDLELNNDVVYFTGIFSDTINFDPFGNQGVLGTTVANNLYYAALMDDGTYNYATNFDGTGIKFGYAVEVYQGNVSLAGYFSNDLDIQPGGSSFILENIGDNDGFIFRLGAGDPCDTTYSVINETACNSFTLNGQVYSASGQYFQTVTNASGCDSLITLNLVINLSSAFEVNASSCESFEFNGQNYTSSGTYTQELINEAGCDSLITINLTIYNTPSLLVIENGTLLSAAQENASYQWYDCLLEQPILEENNQFFEVSSAGSFAVIVSNEACSDTSVCIDFTTVNIDDYQLNSVFDIFPNPSSGKLTLKGSSIDVSRIKLYSALGQQFEFSFSIKNKDEIELIPLNYSPGVYFLIYTMDKKQFVSKLVIQ